MPFTEPDTPQQQCLHVVWPPLVLVAVCGNTLPLHTIDHSARCVRLLRWLLARHMGVVPPLASGWVVGDPNGQLSHCNTYMQSEPHYCWPGHWCTRPSQHCHTHAERTATAGHGHRINGSIHVGPCCADGQQTTYLLCNQAPTHRCKLACSARLAGNVVAAHPRYFLHDFAT
jgi:hypothetical protein